MKRDRGSATLFTLVAVAMLVSPALGALLSKDISPFLNGVDINGSPSAKLGATGSGKLYKETITGILVSYGTGVVVNQSGASQSFSNSGVTIKDLWTNATVTATSNQEWVTPSVFRYSGAATLAIFNPADQQVP